MNTDPPLFNLAILKAPTQSAFATSPLTGTVFKRHKLLLGKMFYIIKHIVHMSINEIASDLNLDFKTVESFVKDVIEIAHKEVSIEKLCAIIEIDEIYVNSGEKGKKGI